MSRENAAGTATTSQTGAGGGPTSSSTPTAITMMKHQQQDMKKPEEEDDGQHEQNGVEEQDDEGFVVVVNRKKHNTSSAASDSSHHQYNGHHHQYPTTSRQHHHQYHSKGNGNHSNYHRQQSQYSDGGGDENTDPGGPFGGSHPPRRRRYNNSNKDQNNQRQQQQQRDNSAGSTNKPFRGKMNRQRDKGSHHNQSQQQHDNNKENANVQQQHASSSSGTDIKTGSNNNGSTSSAASSSSSSSVSNQLASNFPVIKTFSLVVAAGASSPPTNSSTSVPLPQRHPMQLSVSPPLPPQQQQRDLPAPPHQIPTGYHHPAPSAPVLMDNTNDQQPANNGTGLTNRQLLIVAKQGAANNNDQLPPEGASSTPSSVVTERSSSIPDTSSLTSEETIDSAGVGTKSDAEKVEFVAAPAPKVNPWVMNRNAAQVIVGGGTATTNAVAKKSLIGFPSVEESFPDTLGSPSPSSSSAHTSAIKTPTKKVTTTGNPNNPNPSQANSNKQQTGPPRNQTANNNAKQSSTQQPAQQQIVNNPSCSMPSSAPQPSSDNSSKRRHSSAKVESSSTYSQPGENNKSSAHPPNFENEEPSLLPSATAPYVREMSDGFRSYSGRGRGSYSASTSSRNFPSRIEALKKMVGDNNSNSSNGSLTLPPPASNDWPTLGEAEKVHSLPRIKSVGSEDYSSGGEMEKSNKEKEVNSKPVDVVDGSSQPVMKSHSATPPTPKKENQPPTQQQQTPTRSSSTASSNNEACSDNEDQSDDISGTGKNKRASKQKWVPLDIDIATEHQPEGKGKPTGRGGRGRYGGGGGYNSSTYHHSQHHYSAPQHYYQGGRGKGKENYMNGHSDYAEMDRYSRHSTPRGMRGGSRGGSRNHHTRRQNSGPHIHPQRSGSSLSLNGHSLMNGHHSQVEYDLLSPTGVPTLTPGADGGAFLDYPFDFTTLTTMYPAVSDFLMPYVTHTGYFPAPFTAPAATGVIVDTTNAAITSVVSVSPTATTAVEQQQKPQHLLNGGGAHYGDPANDLDALVEQVKTQMEYYFSEVNLEKDFYLRRKMDENGFLPIYILSSFPRVKSMTQDSTIILKAIQSSEHLELNQDFTSVRTQIDPKKWPILDSGNTILGAQQQQQQTQNNNDHRQPASSSVSSSTSKSAESSSSSTSSSSSQTINENNNQHHSTNYHHHHASLSATLADTLNPNVPEFVPKSKVALY